MAQVEFASLKPPSHLLSNHDGTNKISTLRQERMKYTVASSEDVVCIVLPAAPQPRIPSWSMVVVSKQAPHFPNFAVWGSTGISTPPGSRTRRNTVVAGTPYCESAIWYVRKTIDIPTSCSEQLPGDVLNADD